MVRRRKKVAPKRGSKAKFKKCIISKIRGTKIATPKAAQRAFNAAAKKCKHLLVGKVVHRRKKRKPANGRRGRGGRRPKAFGGFGHGRGDYISSSYNLPF
jgi:hypothetical protein